MSRGLVNRRSVGLVVIGLLLYLLPWAYRAYKILPIIEFDQHLVLFGVGLGALLFLMLALFESAPLKIRHLTNFQLVAFVALLSTVALHSLAGITDNYRWLELTMALLVSLSMFRSSFGQPRLLSYLPLLFLPLIYEASKGIVQFVQHDFTGGLPVQGSLINSGTLGNYLASFFPLLVGITWREYRLATFRLSKPSSTRPPIHLLWGFYFSSVLLVGAALVLTYARAAWLGAGVGLLILVASLRKKVKIRSQSQGIQKQLLAHRVVFFSILAVLTSGTLVSYLFLHFKIPSVYGRWQIYCVDWQIIRSNPWLGIGLGKLFDQFNEYQALYFSTHKVPITYQLLATNTFEAFNSILQLTAEAGVIGLIGILSLIGIVMKILVKLWRKNNYSVIPLAATASLTGIVVASLFSNPFHHLTIMVNVVVLLALVPFREFTWSISAAIPKYILLCVTILCVGFVLYWEMLRIKALRQWKTAVEQVGNGHFAAAQPYYERALAVLHTQGEFLYNYGAESYAAGQFARSITLLEAAKPYYVSSELYTYLGSAYLECKQYEKAEQCYRHAIAMTPALMYPKYRLFLLYRLWNRPTLARNFGRQVLNYPVKIPSLATAQMQDTIRNYIELSR